MGPGNLPAVGVFTSGSVLFGSKPGQYPELPMSLPVITWTGHTTVGIWPGWNQTAVPTFRLLKLWLQFSILVLMVS